MHRRALAAVLAAAIIALGGVGAAIAVTGDVPIPVPAKTFTASDGSQITVPAYTVTQNVTLPDPPPNTVTETVTVTVTQPAAPLGTALHDRLPESSGQSTITVSTSGNDSTGNGSSTSPYRTIGKAFSVATSGARIVVRGGTYTGQSVLMNRQFSSTDPVTIENASGETVTLQGSGSGDVLNIRNVRGLRIRGRVGGAKLHVQGAPLYGVRINNSDSIELDRLEVHGNSNTGIYVGGYQSTDQLLAGSTKIDLYGNRVYTNGSTNSGTQVHGLYYGGNQGATLGVIANNVFYDQHTGYCAQLGQTLDGLIFANNTLDACDDKGNYAGNAIQVDASQAGPMQNVTIVNNIATNAGNTLNGTPSESGKAIQGVGSSGHPTVTASNNLGWGNLGGSPEFDNTYGATAVYQLGTNQHGDPAYVNRAAKDFTPGPSSAAIGISDPDYTPPFDLNGTARDASPDLGAIER